MKKNNSNNRKNNTSRHRQRSRKGLSRRKAVYETNRLQIAERKAASGKTRTKNLFGFQKFSFKQFWESKKKNQKEATPSAEQNISNKTHRAGKSPAAIDSDAEHSIKANSENTDRWYHNPRITGAVAAVLLFAMLVAAIVPSGFNVKAEETELASANPTMQLAKEYIYAGSRMLAIEDYGLSSGSTPTPTPTPTITPTPTPVLKPDLVITSFSITPASPVEGEAVNFSTTITNQGQASTPNDWTSVLYKIDGVSPGVDGTWAGTTTSIAPGQSVTFSQSNIPWTAVVGSHTLTAFVDDQNRFGESDETNNLATLNINVNSAPTPTPTPTPAPPVPSIASVSQNTDPTCLNITLNGVSGADSYNVKILNSGYTINVTSLSFPWCGLAPSTYYEYQAQAVNQYGTSGWSGIVGGTTANPPPTPTPTPTPTPEEYSIWVEPNGNRFFIKWTASVTRPTNTDRIIFSPSNDLSVILRDVPTFGGTEGQVNVFPEHATQNITVRFMKDGTTEVARTYLPY